MYLQECNTFGVSIWTSDSASFWPSWAIRIDLILIHLGRMFVVNFLSYKCRDLRIAFCIIEMIACTTLYHSQGGADEIYWFYSDLSTVSGSTIRGMLVERPRKLFQRWIRFVKLEQNRPSNYCKWLDEFVQHEDVLCRRAFFIIWLLIFTVAWPLRGII